jgi:predicted nucleic acid-binding protein
MPSDVFLVDSNVLIRWAQLHDPNHSVVSRALNRLVQSHAVLYYTSQNLGEFWNTVTRPIDRNGYGLSPKEANELAQEIEAQFRLLPDSILVHQEWRRMLVDYGISGVQVHDARLVAAMRVHGVKHILTFNARDFRRFADVSAVFPQDLLAGA